MMDALSRPTDPINVSSLITSRYPFPRHSTQLSHPNLTVATQPRCSSRGYHRIVPTRGGALQACRAKRSQRLRVPWCSSRRGRASTLHAWRRNFDVVFEKKKWEKTKNNLPYPGEPRPTRVPSHKARLAQTCFKGSRHKSTRQNQAAARLSTAASQHFISLLILIRHNYPPAKNCCGDI